MLVGALAVTVVGFILLVLALALSSAWLAWACIVVCVIGFGLLIADVLGMRKPAAETPAPQEADYPPAPDAQTGDGSAEATELIEVEAAEETAVATTDVQDPAPTDTASAAPEDEPAVAEVPADGPVSAEETQAGDQGAGEQDDRTE